MAKTGLEDLNEHLFAQIERLGEEGMSADKVLLEVKRSDAMAGIAGKVLGGGRLAIAAAELEGKLRSGRALEELPGLLGKPKVLREQPRLPSGSPEK